MNIFPKKILLNSLLASGLNVVVNSDKTKFTVQDANGINLMNWEPIRGIQKTARINPTAQKRKMWSVGLGDTLVGNTRYSIQLNNDSKKYFSQSRATINIPSTTPVSTDQPTLKTALYSDIVRQVIANPQMLIGASLCYKYVVTHNAAGTPAIDAPITQSGNTGFSAKLAKGSLVNGASTIYVYDVVGTVDPAKALIIGGVTTSGTAVTATVEGVIVSDKFDYNSFENPGVTGLEPSEVFSKTLTVAIEQEAVFAQGIGSVLVRDRQVMTPGNLDLMYGNSAYSFSESPEATKTYAIISVRVNADTPEGEMGDGAKPNIPVIYTFYVDYSDTAKVDAFEARFTETALTA